MTEKELTDSLYRRFRRCPETLDERHLDLLADYLVDARGVDLDDDMLVFTETPADSPLRRIPLRNVHGVADLGGRLAVVLANSIIFLDKKTLATTVNLKPLSFLSRLLKRIR